jgi:hypothetical protein
MSMKVIKPEVLLDSTLKSFRVAADTAGESRHNFGNGNGGLLFYPSGDSTAFVDRAAAALITIDRDGNLGSVTAPIKPNEMGFYSGSTYGVPGFDAQGRLYYRGAQPFNFPPINLAGSARDTILAMPDSAPILRVDFDARRMDTVARMRVPLERVKAVRSGTGIGYWTMMNPLPSTDEWAYFPDGTIAILRAQDYASGNDIRWAGAAQYRRVHHRSAGLLPARQSRQPDARGPVAVRVRARGAGAGGAKLTAPRTHAHAFTTLLRSTHALHTTPATIPTIAPTITAFTLGGGPPSGPAT